MAESGRGARESRRIRQRSDRAGRCRLEAFQNPVGFRCLFHLQFQWLRGAVSSVPPKADFGTAGMTGKKGRAGWVPARSCGWRPGGLCPVRERNGTRVSLETVVAACGSALVWARQSPVIGRHGQGWYDHGPDHAGQRAPHPLLWRQLRCGRLRLASPGGLLGACRAAYRARMGETDRQRRAREASHRYFTEALARSVGSLFPHFDRNPAACGGIVRPCRRTRSGTGSRS